jgi:hypothetical protein
MPVCAGDLGQGYQTDAPATERQLSPESRLLHHQEHSRLLLDELREWMATLVCGPQDRAELRAWQGDVLSAAAMDEADAVC